ncbi:MAG: class A beta-lactamase-related serine hydrolase [Spirochaetes bacterium]|jgi:beta-lactamase class A|nr:class A beta-lactamase-related serine hydrolase [Spirochaetota bacterium]
MKQLKKKILAWTLFFTILLSFFFILNSPAIQKPLVDILPIIEPDYQWKTLDQEISSDLSSKLEENVMRNRVWNKLARDKKLAIGIVDLADIHNPRTAWINGNVMMYAASLPKIAVLFAAEKAIENGDLQESDDLLNDMNDMIRNSNNDATTRIIDKISLEKIQEALLASDYRFFDRENGGGLWVGKRYAKDGIRQGDPVSDLSHAATVSQTCRFYYLLATGRLINPDRSKKMLDILSRPHLHHKFVNSLMNKYPLNRIYRKSGTWQIWHSDSVLVWGNDTKSRYILVAMVEHPNGEMIMRQMVPVAEKVLQ